jgi:hypothetical protein
MLYETNLDNLDDGDYVTLYYTNINGEDAYFFFDGYDMIVMYTEGTPKIGEVFTHPEREIELRVDKIVNADAKYFNQYEIERPAIHIDNNLFYGL